MAWSYEYVSVHEWLYSGVRVCAGIFSYPVLFGCGVDGADCGLAESQQYLDAARAEMSGGQAT